MVNVQVFNHGSCHQDLQDLGSPYTLLKHWVLPSWMWTSAVELGRALLFSQTLEPPTVFLRNVSKHVAEWWEAITWGPLTCLWQQRNMLVTDYVLAWLKCTALHSGVIQIKVVPSPSLGTRDCNCIYSNFLCADGSPWGFCFQIFFVASEVLWFNPAGNCVPCNHWLPFSPPWCIQNRVLCYQGEINSIPAKTRTRGKTNTGDFLGRFVILYN